MGRVVRYLLGQRYDLRLSINTTAESLSLLVVLLAGKVFRWCSYFKFVPNLDFRFFSTTRVPIYSIYF